MSSTYQQLFCLSLNVSKPNYVSTELTLSEINVSEPNLDAFCM